MFLFSLYLFLQLLDAGFYSVWRYKVFLIF